MRSFALAIVSVAFLVIIVPLFIIIFFSGPAWVQAERPAPKKEDGMTVRVYLHETDEIKAMNLEEYVKGVVAAEMPAEFHPEALKAQAVAARTYAVQNMVSMGGAGLADRPGADVTTDPRLGQGWADEAKMKARWGFLGFQKYWPKINKAVEETQGMILTYQGKPIQAVFHSTSSERTASAKEVWGTDHPYLQSVPSAWDKDAPRYSENRLIPWEDIDKRLGTDTKTVTVSQSDAKNIAQVLSSTESGRVDRVRIGETTFSGQALREKLQLRSTRFSIQPKPAGLEFVTQGYGHGVGLSQYGANGMAKDGRTFNEILTYFYTGVVIEKLH
ncbi:stage II sporulation protein D [Acetonema longum]|uniref:Sporulation protein n=1 Tax=Acetonema longum DSM 6540 TaxID=1009370 RepID=F7NIU5_9FIRM|nr:stage II sporulation protein D [Acetonema longum]EGO64068.1 sporulation protein [Acetonema longum DSM 6540]